MKKRRIIAAGLIVLGALLLLFATETAGGIALIVAGVAVEIIGIALEHKE